MKTSELTGAALDWAVAKCEGGHIGVADNGVFFDAHNGDGFTSFGPSSDWAQGGPIVEREGMDLNPHGVDSSNGRIHWRAAIQWLDESDFESIGPTPLIAAMRCYVASILGDDVEVPDELHRT
jgi:hypothetical protein